MPPCYEASCFSCFMKGFWSTNLASPLQECVLTTHPSWLLWLWAPMRTPRFMVTHLYVVTQCFSGSGTSCSQDHFLFWGDTGKCPGLKNISPPPWFLLCHPMVSRAVTQWTSTKQCGLFLFNLSLHPPIWCHRQIDFTQFLKEMVFWQRSGTDFKLLGMVFVQQNVVCIALERPCCWRSC